MESHYSEGKLADQYDGLIFVNTTSALKVLKIEPKTTKKANLANQNGKRYFNLLGERNYIQTYLGDSSKNTSKFTSIQFLVFPFVQKKTTSTCAIL
jgi:hypothetical protein